jgi:hypothetical protein
VRWVEGDALDNPVAKKDIEKGLIRIRRQK